MVLIASRTGALCPLTVLAGSLALTTSGGRGSVVGVVAVVHTQLGTSDSPGVPCGCVAVDALLSVSLDIVVQTGNA